MYVTSNLALLVPGLAISARRLHDIDRTRWWFLITLTIIGNVWLLVWWCSKGAGRSQPIWPRSARSGLARSSHQTPR
jgi:uncharacterized membrane protein YhaH (DUF805 family)